MTFVLSDKGATVEHVDQDKLWAEFKKLAELNGRDVSWVSEHWNDLTKMYMTARPAPTPPLGSLIDTQ